MSVTETINFLNQNAGVLSGVLTLATTIASLIVTVKLAAETRTMREAQTEPRLQILAAPHETAPNIVTLRIKNVGPGPAYDVRFSIQGETKTQGEREVIEDFCRTRFLLNGLRYLGPGQEIGSHFTQITETTIEKIESRLTVAVEYKNLKRKIYKEEFPIHFVEFIGYGRFELPLYSIAESLKKIEHNLA